MSNLSCVQKFFSKMELVKTLLRIQLKLTSNPEKWLHISTKSPKGFNDTVSQYLEYESKQYNLDMTMNLQVVSVFLWIYSTYLVMLPFKMIFFVFYFISFPLEFSLV